MRGKLKINGNFYYWVIDKKAFLSFCRFCQWMDEWIIVENDDWANAER